MISGDVFDPTEILRLANWEEENWEDVNTHLTKVPKLMNSIFNLKILEKEGIPWLDLGTTIVEIGANLVCPKCNHEKTDKLADYSEFNQPSLVITKEMARRQEGKRTLQLFWDIQSKTKDFYCELKCQREIKKGEKCGQRYTRFLEKKVNRKAGGLILNIDKTKVKKNLQFQVGTELKIENQYPKTQGGAYSIFTLVGGIEEKKKDDDDDSFEEEEIISGPSCLEGFELDPPTAAFNQLVFHFTEKGQYYQIFDSDKISTSSQENLMRCQLLFFKTKRSQQNPTTIT